MMSVSLLTVLTPFVEGNHVPGDQYFDLKHFPKDKLLTKFRPSTGQYFVLHESEGPGFITAEQAKTTATNKEACWHKTHVGMKGPTQYSDDWGEGWKWDTFGGDSS